MPKGFLDNIRSTTYFNMLPLENDTFANLADDTNKFLFLENLFKFNSIICFVIPKILDGLTVLSVETEKIFLNLFFFLVKNSLH